MIALTGYTAIYYLISRQLIKQDDFFAGEYIIKEDFFKPTRNNNLVVYRKKGRSLFIKQPKSFNQSEGRLKHEIQFYQTFGCSLADAKVCLSGLPQHGYDEINQILIFYFEEATESYIDLITSRYLSLSGEALTRVSGQQVAMAHSLMTTDRLSARHPFRTMIPWMLTVQDTYLTEMSSSDNIDVARLGRWLVNHTHILDQLARDWQITHIIHGDLHWSNLLVTSSDLINPTLLLIDWEFAALGDPFWDVATLLSDYLIQSISIDGQIEPERLPILMKTLIASSISQTDDAAWQRVIQLAGLAALQRYYNWINTQTLSTSLNGGELYEEATRYLTNPGSVLNRFKKL